MGERILNRTDLLLAKIDIADAKRKLEMARYRCPRNDMLDIAIAATDDTLKEFEAAYERAKVAR